MPRSKLKKADQSISVKGSKIWNELPLNIRQSTSLGIFKRKAYQHYLDVSDLNTSILLQTKLLLGFLET